MDFDVTSVEGEAQLQTYIQVQQVPNDTDPLMWWKQYHQEFPDLSRMTRQYLTVPDTSTSPERFFSRVGLVQTDLCGSVLNTTMIDLMWDKQSPLIMFQEMIKRIHTHHTHTHTTYSLTDLPIHIHFPLCLTQQYIRTLVRSTVKLDTPHTWSYLTNYQPC